jgi:hypothetical protein
MESADALLLMLIVFHGFDSSVHEACVKVQSTQVTFALFDDLLNEASPHAWLVRFVNFF